MRIASPLRVAQQQEPVHPSFSPRYVSARKSQSSSGRAILEGVQFSYCTISGLGLAGERHAQIFPALQDHPPPLLEFRDERPFRRYEAGD